MNILYHHRTRSTDAQGIHIAEMIHAFAHLGHSVHVAALVPHVSCASHSRIREPLWRRSVRRIPLSFELLQFGYNIAGVLLLIRSILRRRPDFIYERYSLFNFAGVLVSRLFRIPIVLEVNSPLALETAQEGLLRLHRLAQWAEVSICNSATHVVAVTGVLRGMLLRAGVRPDKVRVLHNGVAPERFVPLPPNPALRHSLGLDGRSVIGFVGWFRQWHGLEMLVEAFDQSGLHAKGVSLLLVGDGPAMPALQDAVRRFGLSSSVAFTGPVPHDAIPSYIALFDCAVQPAANQYCCPMKIIEYLALGKPVIAPAQPNILELLDDGVDATLFLPGHPASLVSCLLSLFDTPARLESLAAGAASAIETRGLLWSSNARTVASWFAPPSSVAAVPHPTL